MISDTACVVPVVMVRSASLSKRARVLQNIIEEHGIIVVAECPEFKEVLSATTDSSITKRRWESYTFGLRLWCRVYRDLVDLSPLNRVLVYEVKLRDLMHCGRRKPKRMPAA